MPKNNDVKFEVLHLPPMNTNSLLVSVGRDAVIFDAWGKAADWEKVLLGRGLKLQAIYSTHGHPDHISAAPALACAFNIDWFLSDKDNYLIGWGNELLDMFGIPHIHDDYKKPINLLPGTVEVLPGIKMEIMASPGHTPGGLMFYFPDYKILLTGDTLFAESFGRYDFPGGSAEQLQKSIRNLYNKNLSDETYVVHGHGMDTTIGWLKQHNQFFIA
ncbi:MAG: MBL fold metallo-hydrolase [Alphaproteobacteria bacterium]|nr:MBL fold metallo-hydrolase [Alphaproteobacteria bacterium]